MATRQRAIAIRLGAVATVAVLAAGCAQTSDPAEAGFFSGVSNLATGTYDQRVADREAARARAQTEADRLAARAAELDAERQALAREEAAALQRLQNVNADIAAQQARLTELSGRRDVDTQRLDDLQSRAADLQRRRDTLAASPPTSDPAEIERLEREIDDLRQVIDSIIATVAGP